MALSSYFYDPFVVLSDFDRLFDSAWDNRSNSPNRQEVAQRSENQSNGLMRPRMDLHESKEKNQMTATFELPGLKKDDVNIDVHNNRLVISGQSTTSNELDQEGYAVRERRYGKFSRALPLPQGTKPEDIKASLEHGVLTVTFPKVQAEQAPKKITIS
ncbi:hypothetical protein M422DRAFT_165769 [Sphaerobolus stellatus SS14]|uniref:SHSP domain-containing protein n=1 Tax=Sphaerobolus stellatus (strain SS14) TaxID=990650 RepID=A0A0C9UTC3_SPHS4|nr:hypothetical protein M422DRAFT_165769 [Sphaerobolus stellatus SS14]